MYPADRELTPTSFESITGARPVGDEPDNKPSRLRRAGRVCRRIGAVALVAICAAVVFIHTGWGKELARSHVEAALADKVDGAVSLGSVDYGFMFSDVELRDLHIADAAGDPAIALDRLVVDLDRTSLLSGAPVLDRVQIGGLKLAVRKNADGSSNLTGLFKKSDRSARHIRVVALEVADSSVEITKVDGTRYQLDDLAVAGSIDANAVARAYAIELASISARAAITRPGAETRSLRLGLGEVSATIDAADGRELQAALVGLRAGPLSVERIDATAGLAGGALAGNQVFELEGMRVAAAGLEELLGRPVLGGDITGDLVMTGPPEAIDLDGVISTSGGRVSLSGAVDVSDMAAPGYSLRIAGDDLATAELLAAPGPRSIESQVEIRASGAGFPGRPDSQAELSVDVGDTAIDLGDRALDIDALVVRASSEGRQMTLETLTASVGGLEIAAAGSLSPERQVSADVEITADPAGLVRTLAGLGLEAPPVGGVGTISLSANARGALDGSIAVELAPAAIRLAGGRAELSGDARLERRAGGLGLSTADIAVDLGGVDIQKLASLAGRTVSLAGVLDGRVAIERRGAARTLRYDVGARLERPALALTARGAVTADRATAAIETGLARIEASVPLTRRAGRRALALDGDMAVDVEIPKTRLSAIAALLPADSAARLRARARRGVVAARVSLAGTPRTPRGTIAVEADAELARLAGRAVEIDADLAISGDRGRVTIAPDAAISLGGIAGQLAEITGSIALGDHVAGGRLDLGGAARAAELALAVDIAERPAASLAPLRKKLGRAGGDIAAHIAVAGSPAAPELSGAARWSSYATAAGVPGAARLTFEGTPAALAAEIELGARDARDRATIDAEIRRGDRLEVSARARAAGIRVAGVVPAIAALRELGADLGTLDWNMDADVALARTDAGLELSKADVRGHLEVAGGALPVPGSDRRYHGIDLRVEARGDRVELTRLVARESDAARRDRQVSVSGALELASMKPRRLALDIRASDWLVFGGSMGHSDAPRAELDADLAVAVDLDRPIWAVDATVRSLHLSYPRRFARAHGLEQISVNRDIMFLDQPGVEVGKLAPARPVAGAPAAEPRKRRPMDIRLRFARPARITKDPIDVRATGELAIAVRPDGVTKRGTLELVDGEIYLFGHPHELERGRLIFDEARPGGEMDLVFARELSPQVVRQLSRKSGGTKITVSLSGPLSSRQISLGGPGAGGFIESLAWQNAGRGMYHTAPGLPASASVQAPRGDQPLVLTFIQVNLAHMQLLERFSAWSDPYRDRDGYGRVEHFEGERYGRDNSTRVKVVARPEDIGRSRTEVQLDRLWINRDDLAVGAGVRAGSRRGGGVGVFLEWSSDD